MALMPSGGALWHAHSVLEMPSVEVVTSAAGMDGLRSDWDRLVDMMDVPSPFLSWDWSRIWWEHFGGRHRMQMLVFREGGAIVGILALYRRRYGPITVLVPFGWPDRLTEQMEPVVPTHSRARVLASLSAWLKSKRFTIGLITGLEGAAANMFRDQTLSDPVTFEWRMLPPTWDELTKDLTRSMRGNIRYYPRLMEREGHTLAYRTASSVDEVKAALPTLFRLHTERASETTGERHRDRLKYPKRREFLFHLADVLAPRGQMKIGILEVDGRDVAAHLWFERAGTMFIHYSGYEPGLSRYSVAMVTTSEIIRLGVAQGMRRIEFLRGSKAFKTRWNTVQRVQSDVYYVWNPWVLPMFHRVRSIRRKVRGALYRRVVPLPVPE
jgi:CelD/BcsL family acetyltransferase involved in cellulose biosynthesis